MIKAAIAGWLVLTGVAWHDYRCLQYEEQLAETRMDAREMETLANNLLNKAKLRLEYDPKTGRQRYHFDVQYSPRSAKK